MLLVDFLIERLVNMGVKHVFGVPGEDVLDLFKSLSESKDIKVITCVNEEQAGFAADAYARVKGVGCVVAPYKVGALSLINTTQCAYAERSPVVVISGAPATKEKRVDGLVPQRELFEKVTCCSIVLDNAVTAGYDIDNSLVALCHYMRPVYWEIPKDMLKKSLTYDVYKQGTPNSPKSDPHILEETIQEVVSWLQSCKKPVILAGVELARCGLGETMIRFAEITRIPIVITALSKSIINENHPLFAGIYTRGSSPLDTKELVETSDCLLMLGVISSDTVPEKRDTIHASIDQLKVRNHTYKDVNFSDFCTSIFKLGPKLGLNTGYNVQINSKKIEVDFSAKEVPVTVARLFQRIGNILTPTSVVVADIGDAMFGALELPIHERARFFGPAFYSPMGFAIPGALATQIADTQLRPIVIVGDGAFQMSVSGLGTIAQHKLSPIIFVINNKGFALHRHIVEGTFNDIRSWGYHKVTDLLEYGKGFNATTETELDTAITEAIASKTLCVINVHVSPKDASPRMRRMLEAQK